MKAYVLHGANDLQFEEVNKPILKEREVMVKIEAVGICGSDIPRIYQTGAHTHPLIPGHEFSGRVVEVGENSEGKWLDKRVGIFPLIPCGECIPCRKMRYEMCRNYSYLGSRRNGGFAEYVAVPEWNLIELPENVSYEEAAMLEPMAVAVHAMRRIKPGRGETVVVCGLGTIGLLLSMFLKEAGIEKLLVIGNKEFQEKCVSKMGISEADYCDCRKQKVGEWIMERTEGKGTDVFLECVGKNETISQAIDLTAPGGRVMLMGNPYSDMMFEKAIYWKILRNQLMVMGTWNSSFTKQEDDDWHYVLEKLAQGRIAPEVLISHRLVLEELEHGLKIMRNKSEDYVKIMGRFEDS